MRDLYWLLYICYTILLKKNMGKVKTITFINFRKEINIMNLAYGVKLDFEIYKN